MSAIPYSALLVSLTLAICTVIILLIICIPSAWWIAQYRGKGKALLQTLVTLPLVLPPTVLGFYLLVVFAPDSMLGQVWQTLTGSTLAFSFAGILLGSTIYSLPFVMQPLIQEFQQTGVAYYRMMQSMGIPRITCLYKHVLPACKGSIIMATTLGFAHTLGEFGLILLIGGSIPGETRVLSVELYHQVMLLDYASAHTSAFILLGLSGVSLWLLYYLAPQHSVVKF